MARPTVYTDLLVKGSMSVEGGIVAPRKAFGSVYVNEASGAATTHTISADDMREVVIVNFGDKSDCVLTLSQPEHSEQLSVLVTNFGSKAVVVKRGERSKTITAGVTVAIPLRF